MKILCLQILPAILIMRLNIYYSNTKTLVWTQSLYSAMSVLELALCVPYGIFLCLCWVHVNQSMCSGVSNETKQTIKKLVLYNCRIWLVKYFWYKVLESVMLILWHVVNSLNIILIKWSGYRPNNSSILFLIL